MYNVNLPVNCTAQNQDGPECGPTHNTNLYESRLPKRLKHKVNSQKHQQVPVQVKVNHQLVPLKANLNLQTKTRPH